MVVETSWNTATGWAIVRDTLLMGPWHRDGTRDSTHRRAPTDYDAEHILLRTVRCVNGEVQMTIDCEPVFDYGQLLGRWEYAGDDYRQGVCRAEGSDVTLTLTSDINLGFEGPRALAGRWSRRARLASSPCRGARSRLRRRSRMRTAARSGRAPLAALAGARPLPGPSVARIPRTFGADPQGPHLCPERRDHRGRHDVAPRNAARRTELGLPLQLDPRLDVRAVGPVHARLRLGSERLHGLRGRRRRRGGRAPGDVRRRWRAGARGTHPRPPRGLRRSRPVRVGNGAFNQRQHDVGARCSTRSTCT